MNKEIFEDLIILEMANNHMGDVSHGLRMIKEFSEIVKNYRNKFRFAWKFQFRDIDTFIHPDYKNRTNLKYVKRFKETALTKDEFLTLKKEVEKQKFITICTAFDENSVNLLSELDFEIVKIGSCSFTDWPLLNKVVELDKPIIASTAGATLKDIDNVVSFFLHRDKNFALMHCVGEYPTQDNHFQLNQIDLLKERYADIPIGFSTHESPIPKFTEPIHLAIAKGVRLFEKHVAVSTDRYPSNAYSAEPHELEDWLSKACSALELCGVVGQRHIPTKKELSDLRQFQRGVFAKNKINSGEYISRDDMFFAWPNEENQLVANDISKYKKYKATTSIDINKPIMLQDVEITETREKVWDIVQEIKAFVKKTGVVVPEGLDLEISHHYGIDKFHEYGSAMFTVINRDYCKKLIITLPGQAHPAQFHRKKEETFIVLSGEAELLAGKDSKTLKVGDVYTIKVNTPHTFSTRTGCIIEEISSTHYKDDSYYIDENINKTKDRKTYVTYWND